MLIPLKQPVSRYQPPHILDLSDKTVRQSLSAGALSAFFNMMDLWKIRDSDARGLLGDVSNGTYYALKKGSDKPLDADRLRRISMLVAIFKSLNILHDTDLADTWMTRPNSNRLFAGKTPVNYLLHGGLPAFDVLRRHLDARRGG